LNCYEEWSEGSNNFLSHKVSKKGAFWGVLSTTPLWLSVVTIQTSLVLTEERHWYVPSPRTWIWNFARSANLSCFTACGSDSFDDFRLNFSRKFPIRWVRSTYLFYEGIWCLGVLWGDINMLPWSSKRRYVISKGICYLGVASLRLQHNAVVES